MEEGRISAKGVSREFGVDGSLCRESASAFQAPTGNVGNFETLSNLHKHCSVVLVFSERNHSMKSQVTKWRYVRYGITCLYAPCHHVFTMLDPCPVVVVRGILIVYPENKARRCSRGWTVVGMGARSAPSIR